MSVKVKETGTKSPILKMLFFPHLIIQMSLNVNELMIIEFYLQNMRRSLQKMAQKAPKMGIFGLKIAEEWDFWAKNYFFVC